MCKENPVYFVRLLTFALVLFIYSSTVTGQETKNPKNSVNLEGATALYVGMYSLNYERSVYQSPHFKMAVDAGLGQWYFTTIASWNEGYSIPLSVNSLLGSRNNFFEVDLGIRYTMLSAQSDKDVSSYTPVANLGYRHQRADGKGLIFRTYAGLSGIGIGIGKAF